MHADGRAAGLVPDPVLASCRFVLQAHPWTPVLQRSVPNRGDNEYGYYGAAGQFHLGLYRLGGT